MKNIKRVAASVMCLMLCVVLLLLTGCNDKTAALLEYNQPEKYDKLSTTSVAENSRYSLIWDGENSRVVLYDKARDIEWSYVPQESINSVYDEDGYEKGNHPIVESPIIVTYYTTTTLVSSTTNAYAQSINKGDFTLRAIDNGIEMVCYFEKLRFTIPVSFVLTDDGMDISVDVSRIEEDDEYCISAISIAPMFCSVSNDNAGKDEYYMFMPSGSGTIINPLYTDGVGTKISESVYGADPNIEKEEMVTVTENIKTPVYGSVNSSNAVCAIIKEGAEYANIEVMMGQALTGYSYIYSTFEIRGYQEAIQSLFTSKIVKTNLYCNAFTPDNIRVSFNPLYDDDASYVGMAKLYREYLEEEGLLNETADERLLNLKLYGGITTTKFVLGIPTDDMLVATTIKQAESMVKELVEKTGEKPNVNLIGFGESGNDIGAIAGGYELSSEFGKDKELKKLSQYCTDNGIGLFMNFDMIRFRRSSDGISTTFDKADSANASFTPIYYYDVNFRTNSKTLDPYYLVSRTKFDDIASKVKKAANSWNLGGVSLDTLTSMVYSDYSDYAYYGSANFAKQAIGIINSFNAAGYKVAGSDANAFAAGVCDHVYDVPVRSSNYRIFSENVPFYQIVFKGSVSMSTTSLNLATNKNDILLSSVESGCGLTYSLIGEYDTNLISSAQNVFYGSVYWDEVIGGGVRDDIISTVAEYKDYFESVKGASISDHEIINENVRKTTFDNGVSVYVNYSDTDFETADGVVAAGSYITVK